jgi:hypothetical protein
MGATSSSLPFNYVLLFFIIIVAFRDIGLDPICGYYKVVST